MSRHPDSSWRARVEALTPAQRDALANALDDALQQEALRGAVPRLTAFVVPEGGTTPGAEALRTFLAARVPDHMIPSRFVVVEALPRTAAGKLDRAALRRLDRVSLRAPTDEAGTVAAPSELESRLLAIWRTVLKLEELGLDDDFFEVGGDSLLSIRVIARAGREGIRLSPERFFERPTVRHMAATVEAEQRSPHPASFSPTAIIDAVGRAPLTPIQHWFLDAVPAHRDWWNQGFVLALEHSLDTTALREVIGALLDHHDALRLTLVREGTQWQQEFRTREAVAPLRVVDVGGEGAEGRSERVRLEGEREHQALHLEHAPLFRCVLLEGDDGWRRLLLIGHHLVLDGVSWGVILEDLATLATQATTGMPLQLPERTAPARAWALALAAAATAPAVTDSLTHWLALAPAADQAQRAHRPFGSDEGGSRVAPHETWNRDAAVATVVLDVDETRRLVHDATRQLEAPVQALLLSALLVAWCDWQGDDSLTLDLEGHGRDALGDALDVSRTVGWFTSVFPVRLALPMATGAETPPRIEAVVRGVHASLNALPMRGASYGLLRYLSPDRSIRTRLSALPRPSLVFNFLGTFDLSVPARSGLRLTAESTGRTRDPDAVRPYLLELNARLQEGRLVVEIEYARTVHDASTIDRFARALRSALDTVSRTISPRFDAAALKTIAALLDDLDGSEEDHDGGDGEGVGSGRIDGSTEVGGVADADSRDAP